MSEIEFNCPHCRGVLKLEIDGMEQDESQEEECYHCNKKYKVYYTISIDVFADKLEFDFSIRKKGE